MDAKNLYDGVARLLSVSLSRELPKPVSNGEEGKSPTENGELPSVENGIASVEHTGDANTDEKQQKSPTLLTDERPSDV